MYVSSRRRPFRGNASLTNELRFAYDLDDNTNSKVIVDKLDALTPGTLVNTSGTHNTEDISVVDMLGRGLSFDGAVDYIDLGTLASKINLDMTEPFSFMMNMVLKPNLTGSTTWMHFFDSLSSSSKNGIVMFPMASSAQYSSFYFEPIDATTAGYINFAQTGFEPKQMVCTYDGSSDRAGLGLYVNTIYKAGIALAYTTPISQLPARLGVAANLISYPVKPDYINLHSFYGWQRELTAAEVAALYNGGDMLKWQD